MACFKYGDISAVQCNALQVGLLLIFLTVMNNLHDGETNVIEGISHFALFSAFIALVVMGVI